MSSIVSRAPRPALSEHPEFAMMVAVALERFHCTLGEIREDYWLGRLWRALAGDPALAGRVARSGVAVVLLTGPRFGPGPDSALARELWRRYALERIRADTGHTADALGVALQWASQPVRARSAPVLSLLAQALLDDARWGDLTAYAGDLSAVDVPVADLAEGVVAA